MTLRIALGSALLALVALLIYGLAQPLPVAPVIVPIGAHASPEEFARSQVPSHLALRVLVEHDGRAAALFLSDEAADQDESQVVFMHRTSTGGWFGGGGGRGAGPRSARQALPVGVMVTSGSSRSDAGGSDTYVSVGGRASASVVRVEIALANGAREDAKLENGGYLWLRTLSLSAAAGTALPLPADANPIELVAFSADGREVHRQSLGLRQTAQLQILSKGAPTSLIRINGTDAITVACNGGAALRPGESGVPPLPWDVEVSEQRSGRHLLSQRITELPRWLLVTRDSAGVSTSPISGPFVPCD